MQLPKEPFKMSCGDQLCVPQLALVYGLGAGGVYVPFTMPKNPETISA